MLYCLVEVWKSERRVLVCTETCDTVGCQRGCEDHVVRRHALPGAYASRAYCR